MGLFKRVRADVAGQPSARGAPLSQSSSPAQLVLPRGVAPVWLAGRTEVQVAGESFHQAAILSALAKAGPAGSMTAVLIPETANPHDRNAVAVYLDAALAGHLPREVAARVHAVLLAFGAARGGPVACPARVSIYDIGPQVILSLDPGALALPPEAFDAPPELAMAIQWLTGRLDRPAPAMAGADMIARASLSRAERDRADVDADYDRPASALPACEDAFRRIAATLERARDPLVSEAWLGVARSVRYQPGRRDDFLGAVIEAVYWDRANGEAWAELVDYASSAPHVATLVALFARVPLAARSRVLQQLLSMSRGTDRLGRMSPEAGEDLRAALLALATSEGDKATAVTLSRRRN
jgi:hypothetical protein